jgi:concanavalin A-like lectin/glucanase superfamily protein
MQRFLGLAVGVVLVIGFVSSAQGAPQGCLPPRAGLTAWWPGDGTTDDIIGGRNATLHGNASVGLGFVQEAFLLHGNGDFVSVTDDPTLDFGTNDFTIDLWAFFSDPGTGEQILMEKWIQRFDGPPTGWTFTKVIGNELLLTMESGDGNFQGSMSESLAIPAGTWMHFAATRQAGLISLYVNGDRVASNFWAQGNLNADSTSSLKFGHRGNPTDTPGSQDPRGFFLSGGIDEVQIFIGRALTQGQILAIYNAGPKGQCKP